MKGQLVRELAFRASSLSRFLEVNWDGKDENGKEVKSSIYFCIVNTQSEQVVKKITIIR
jgi:hypothetical protein